MADLEMNDRSLQVPSPNIINDNMITSIDNNSIDMQRTTTPPAEKPIETTKTTSYITNGTENPVENTTAPPKSPNDDGNNNNNNDTQSKLHSDSFDISVDDQELLSSYFGKIENMSNDEFADLPENDQKRLSKYIDTEHQVLTNQQEYQVVKTNYRTSTHNKHQTQTQQTTTQSTNRFEALGDNDLNGTTTTPSQQIYFTFGGNKANPPSNHDTSGFAPGTFRPHNTSYFKATPNNQYSNQNNRIINTRRQNNAAARGGGRGGGRRSNHPAQTSYGKFHSAKWDIENSSSDSDSEKSTDTVETSSTASPTKTQEQQITTTEPPIIITKKTPPTIIDTTPTKRPDPEGLNAFSLHIFARPHKGSTTPEIHEIVHQVLQSLQQADPSIKLSTPDKTTQSITLRSLYNRNTSELVPQHPWFLTNIELNDKGTISGNLPVTLDFLQ
jgi:hypothetical protein